MTGPVYQYLANDHRRLEDALRRATNGGSIEPSAYLEFRCGLLRHIGMEEKILMPAAQAAQGGRPLAAAERLHLDHGALAALLVLSPTTSIITAVRHILEGHNRVEEGPGGVYAQCESLPGFDSEKILARLEGYPPVAMAPYSDKPIALTSARDALKRAGYDLRF